MAKIGERIGTYEITQLLGSGGMAMVYAARHTSLDTDHALKILLPNYASNPRTVERFRQEARAQFRMRHPNIVQVTDFVEEGDNLALVMDLIPGITLAEAMRQSPGPWPVEDVVAVMRPVLEAMTYAHREGLDGAAVVHRDLKPENVMLDLHSDRPWPGVPKVMDFGIAKVLGASNVATATNARMGTLGYMSPEQFRNAKDVGAPADVWALGVMLWQLLTGRLPVDPENNFALLDLYRGVTPVPLLTEVVPGMPVALSQAVAQAMALDPGDRFADAAPLLRAVNFGVTRRVQLSHGQLAKPAGRLAAPRQFPAEDDLPPPLPDEMPPLPDQPQTRNVAEL
jgi:serine/threonine protein kinase